MRCIGQCLGEGCPGEAADALCCVGPASSRARLARFACRGIASLGWPPVEICAGRVRLRLPFRAAAPMCEQSVATGLEPGAREPLAAMFPALGDRLRFPIALGRSAEAVADRR